MSTKNQLLIRIDTDNAAFDDMPEDAVSEILDVVSRKLLEGHKAFRIQDFNGNTVGECVWVTPDA
jgi:hypothetical protein